MRALQKQNTLLCQAVQRKTHKQELDLDAFILYTKTSLETYSLNEVLVWVFY